MQAIVNYGQDYIALLIKIIGITYVTQFASDLCKKIVDTMHLQDRLSCFVKLQ